MNRIYKVIWNQALSCFTVVGEYAKARGKSSKSSVSSNATINTTSNLSSINTLRLSSIGLGLLAAGFGMQTNATGTENHHDGDYSHSHGSHGVHYHTTGSNSHNTNSNPNHSGDSISLKFKGDNATTITRSNGETLNILGGATGTLTNGNIGVFGIGDTLTIQLAENIDLGADGSLKMGNTLADSSGITIRVHNPINNVVLSHSGLNNGNNVITGVAPGAINSTSTDAVNGSQLDAINTTVAANKTKYYSVNSTGGSNVNNDGAIGADAIAIGKNASAVGQTTVTIGTDSGTGSTLNTREGVSVGNASGQNVLSQGNVGIGASAGSNISATPRTTVGGNPAYRPYTIVGQNTAIGAAAGNGVYGDSNSALGERAGRNVDGHANTAVGAFSGNAVVGSANVAMGPTSGYTVTGDRNTAVGNFSGSHVVGKANSAFGNGAGSNVTGEYNLALGATAGAGITSNLSIAIGNNAGNIAKGNVGESSISVGTNSSAQGSNSMAIGRASVSAGENATGIGVQAKAEAKNSVAIGQKAQSTGISSVAIGDGANASEESSIAIGNLSTDRAATTETGITINGTPYTYEGSDPIGVMSVGFVGGERQIINVAAGAINASSTDAVNGSQLHATNTAVNKNSTTIGSGLNFDGDTGTTVNRQLGQTLTVKGGAINLSDNNIGVVADGTNTLTVKLAKDLTGLNSVTTGNTVMNTGGVSFLGASSVRLSGTGLDNGSNQITNVASGGTTATNAANIGDISSAVAANKTKYYSVNSTATGNINNDGATGQNAMAMGGNTTATGGQAIAIGSGQSGQHTTASGQQSIAIGANVVSKGHSSIALGGDDLDDASKANVGNNSVSAALNGGTVNTVFKNYAGKDMVEASQFDVNTESGGAASIAIGVKAQSKGDLSTAVGVHANSAGTASSAFGMAASATKKGALALGAGSQSNAQDGVALGSKSVASVAGGATGFVPVGALSIDENAIIKTKSVALGAVSIGTGEEGGNRQIVNLAAGTSDSDAVNVAQLKGLQNGVNYTLNQGIDFGGDSGTKVNRKLGEKLLVKGGETNGAKLANGNNIGVVSNGTDTLTIKLAKDLTGINSVTTGNSLLNNNGLSITGGPKFTATGIDANSQQIQGVASGGTIESNAANIGDLNTAITGVSTLGFGLKAADGNIVRKPLGQAVEVVGSNNNIDTRVNNGKIEVELNDNLDLGNNGSVKMGSSNPIGLGPVTTINRLGLTTGNTLGSTAVNGLGVFVNGPLGIPSTGLTADGLTILNGPSMTRSGGIDAGNKKITNVKAGVAVDDAVNVSQLTSASAAARTEVGAGTNITDVVKTTGSNGQDIYTVNADGVTASAGSTAVTVTAAAKDTATNMTDYAVDLSDASKASLVKADSAMQSVVTQIDGNVVKTLDKDNNSANFLTGDNIILTAEEGGIKVATAENVSFTTVTTGDTLLNTEGVSFLGGSTVRLSQSGLNNGGNQITNVADGDAPMDAVNVRQLGAVTDIASRGWNISAQGNSATASNVGPGGTVDFNSKNSNIIVSKDSTSNDVSFKLNNNLDLSNTGSIKIGSSSPIGLGLLTTVDRLGLTTGNTLGSTAVNGLGVFVNGPLGIPSTGLTADGLTILNGPSMTRSGGIDAGNKKITNVKAGVAVDDAVNVSQLTSASAAARTEVGAGTNITDVVKTTGSNGQDIYTVNADGVTASAGSTAVTVTAAAKDTATNMTDYAVDLSDASKASLVKADSAMQSVVTQIDGNVVKTLDKDNNSANFLTGDNIILTAEEGGIKVATAENVSFTTVTTGDTLLNTEGVSFLGGSTVRLSQSGLNNGGNRITNVADGKDDTDAVNIRQLNATNSTLDLGLDFTGDDTTVAVNRKLGQTLTIQGGATNLTENNIGILADEKGNLNVRLAEDVILGKNGSVRMENTVLNNAGITITDGPKQTITLSNEGLDNGNNRIIKVGEGIAPSDAVNFAQLTKTNNEIAKGIKIGDGNNDNDQQFELGDTINVTGDSNLTTVASATGVQVKLNSQLNLGDDGSMQIGNSIMNNAGFTFGDNGSGTRVMLSSIGLDNGGNPIRNVGKGTLNTDAVNVEQLKEVAIALDQGWGITAQGDIASMIKQGNTVDMNSRDGNIKVSRTSASNTAAGVSAAAIPAGANDISFDLNPDINVVSVTAGDTTVNDNGLTIAGGPSVTKNGIDAANNKITNVQKGEVTATSQEAINGSQLYAQGSGISSIIGGNTVYDPTNGTFTNSNIGGTGQGSIDGAIASIREGTIEINENVQTNTTNIATNTTSIATNTTNIATNITNIKANKDRLDAGLNFGADSGTNINKPVGDSSVLKFTGGNNITTTAQGSAIKFDLNSNITVDSVKTGNTTVNNNGITIANGPSMTANGIDAASNKITNVADGMAPRDAVNFGQLDAVSRRLGDSMNELGYKIGEVEDDANAGISAAMAMSSLPQAYIIGKSMIGGGIGTYNGESAVAIGFSKLSNDGRWVMKLNGTADTQGNAGASIGAGFHFD